MRTVEGVAIGGISGALGLGGAGSWVKTLARQGTMVAGKTTSLIRSIFKRKSAAEKLAEQYSVDNYKRELGVFFEKQIEIYFQEASKAVQTYVEENNYEYLILTIRRNHLKYKRLYFFLEYDFLDDKFKQNLNESLKKKLYEFENELIVYFDKLALYTDSLSEVSTNIKRLIEV